MEKILYNYCAANIEGFKEMEGRALSRIDNMRCRLCDASPELFKEMEGAIERYCEDERIEDTFDVEEVFWSI